MHARLTRQVGNQNRDVIRGMFASLRVVNVDAVKALKVCPQLVGIVFQRVNEQR